jgi:hypothetical protein
MSALLRLKVQGLSRVGLVRPLKWNVSWFSNVVRQFGPYLTSTYENYEKSCAWYVEDRMQLYHMVFRVFVCFFKDTEHRRVAK